MVMRRAAVQQGCAPMPVFRFFFVNGEKELPLRRCEDLRDVQEAVRHAERAIQTVFQDQQLSFDWFNWRLSVRTDEGKEVAQVPFPEALTDENKALRTS
jgi:hypothetical protein